MRNRKGFTLVELLVVIGIIAVLIAILLPALSRARSQSIALKCSAQLRDIGQQLLLYAGENKGSIFPCGPNGQHLGGALPFDQRWPNLVFKLNLNAANFYVPDLMRCPADDRTILDGGDVAPWGGHHSYDLNSSLFPEFQPQLWARYGSKVPRYENSDVLLMSEKHQNRSEWHLDDTGVLTTTRNQYYGLLFDQDGTDPGVVTNSPRANNKPKYKHGKMGNNYLYLDFSVRNQEPVFRADPSVQWAPHRYLF